MVCCYVPRLFHFLVCLILILSERGRAAVDNILEEGPVEQLIDWDNVIIWPVHEHHYCDIWKCWQLGICHTIGRSIANYMGKVLTNFLIGQPSEILVPVVEYLSCPRQLIFIAVSLSQKNYR